MPRPRSISEVWGERITRSLVVRMLCGAWLVPAASLTLIGLATIDVRHTGESSQVLALGRTRRPRSSWPCSPCSSEPAPSFASTTIGRSTVRPIGSWHRPPARRPSLDWSHGVAAVLATVTAGVASVADGLAVTLFPVAAGLGFWAVLALTRVLRQYADGRTSPLVGAFGGYLVPAHGRLAPSDRPDLGPGSGTDRGGTVLAWVAAAAARVDPFAFPFADSLTTSEMVVTAENGVEIAVDVEPAPVERIGSVQPGSASFSPGPAQPSIPKAAVGR